MKKGLGRGLSSLFSVYEDYEDTKKDIAEIKNVSRETMQEMGIAEIEIGLIDPNLDQPRKIFDEAALNELSESIKNHGVIQPIVVIKKDDRYMIIAGERRWRASKLAKLKTIPAIIKSYNERDIKEISIIENLQRENLNPIEMATAFKALMTEYGWTQETVAERLGKSRPMIANTVRLLNLQPEVIEMIEKGELSMSHARSLIVVTNRNQQLKLAEMAKEKKLTVRDMEVATSGKAKKSTTLQQKQNSDLKQFQIEAQRALGTKVNIIGNENRGRISIDYFNREDLDRIYEIIMNK